MPVFSHSRRWVLGRTEYSTRGAWERWLGRRSKNALFVPACPRSSGLLIPGGWCWVAACAGKRHVPSAVLCPEHGPEEPQPLWLSRRGPCCESFLARALQLWAVEWKAPKGQVTKGAIAGQQDKE